MEAIETIIDSLPKEEQVIVKRLRALIMDAEPRIQESISYGVLFFSRRRRIFFLWPASLTPCKSSNYSSADVTSVTLGFCYGCYLSNVQGLLSTAGRKQVATVNVSSLTAIDEPTLRQILYEAILIDEHWGKQKQTPRK